MKNLVAQSSGQKDYLDALTNNKIVFCIGPAGSGKTFIASRYAANKFASGTYHKIILCRPLIAAGNENIGYLPGDINKKMDPFIRPVYDELVPFFSAQKLDILIENRTIETVPFAFLRGRTFHKSIIIVDEAQNCTEEQLKLILTRFGQESKMIINGDITQTDLNDRRSGALLTYSNLLKDVKDIATVHLTKDDIQREKIIVDILNRIEND